MPIKKGKSKKKKIELGPVLSIILLTGEIALLSVICSLFGVAGSITEITGTGLESKLVYVNSFLSGVGIRYILSTLFTNFSMLNPLLMTIVALIGIGIAEKSGLFKAMFINLRRIRPSVITFATLLLSILCGFFGDYAYAFIIPVAAIVYKYAGRNSRLGVLTAFIGVSVGLGSGLLFNNTTLVLGTLTQAAAALDVDKNYVFSLSSTLYVMIASTLLLAFFGTLIIDNMLAVKYTKKTPLEDEDLNVSKKGLRIASLVAIILFGLVLYMLIPGLPFSGLLLDRSANTYIEQLVGFNTAFGQSSGYIFMLILMICSFIYGKISGNIVDTNDYSVKVSDAFDGIGYLFVLLFFASQMVSILDWTNFGTVISGRLISFLGSISMSGIPLIVSFFIIVIIMGILVPDTVLKWELLSPVIVPLFMRSNITPEFTQFIYTAADGCSKMITPFFSFYIVMIAFLQRYNYDEENKITIFGTLRKILPTVLVMMLLWLLIILAWYIIGLPLGPETFTNL